MVDDDQGATIHHGLPVWHFDVFNRLVHHGVHFASRVANRSVRIQRPGEVYFLGFRYLAGEVAIEIVPQLPTVSVELPSRPVIDEEINSRIVGIAEFLVRTLLQQFLTERMIEPNRPSAGGMLDPVDVLRQATKERHSVMPLGVFQEARSSGQITQFFLLRGPLAGEHVPALYAE